MKYLYGQGPGRMDYVSEFTRFMEGYLDQHPEVRRDQVLGWRIFWERFVNPQEIDREIKADMGRPAYYYD